MNSLRTLATAKSLLISALFAGLSLASQAQTTAGKIIGTIGDDNQKPIESATISLLNAKDSSSAGSTASDKTGHFHFDNIKEGNYLISASSVGHTTSFSPLFEVLKGNAIIALKPIIIRTAVKDLKEVAVIGKRPLFEQKADRMVVNVDASPSNAGSTAMDVLEKSPGITVDKDDNISLKGKQGVTIMIDNKPTYMSASQLASYLKGLPASAIDQIEIMTNPSAKYDAAGNSGIINLKTKKNKTKGFNGSLTLSQVQGVYPKPSGSINLNYRNGKTNFFLNAGVAQWEGYQNLDITRKYLDPTPAKTINSIFTQQTRMKFRNPEMNLKFGMDYYLTDRTTLGFVVSGFQNKEHHTGTSNIFLMDPNKVVDSIGYSPSNINTTWKNGSVNLNFRHQFDSAGTELTADADYVRYTSSSSQYFDNITYYPDMTKKNETILTGDLPSNINISSFKADFSHPFTKEFKLEAGVKTSYVTTDNTAGYFNLINNVPEVDTTKTNRFRYDENINAAYLNLNRQYKKWGIQAGLRYENTNYSGHQLGNGTATNRDSTFKKSYSSLFPTVYISYQANKKNSFSVNYGRRIDRPAYEDLNPFLFFLDQYTYQAGNPYLRPQFTHNVELSHTYNNFLTTTLNYSYTKDFFTETFEQQGHATIVRRGNIGSMQNAGIAVSANVPVTKWWTSILYTNLTYSEFKGPLYGENIDVSATNLMLNLNNQFTFSHGWGAEISGFYRTKGVEGQVIVNPMGQASATVSKKLLSDKASIKLGIRDIFYTQQVKGYINFQQTEATFHNSRDSRQVSMTFSYRFGKPLKSTAGRRHSGAGDEQNRVKAGGGN
ncbi:MAG TPA: TonB-dependent receptor [Puia sp.]|nr:TonB-dependent receptor [Puia sp.]